MGTYSANSGELDMVCLAAPSAAGMVRTLVDFRLRAWGAEHVADDVFLVVGELVANAVQSTPDREIRVRLLRVTQAVVFEVWDASDALPLARPVVALTLDDVRPDARALDDGYDDGTGGWGLPLVQAVSRDCGVRKTQPSGKWVWAMVAL